MIIDSSVIIEVMEDEKRLSLVQKYLEKNTFLSAVSVAEVVSFATRAGQPSSKARRACNAIGDIIPIDETIATRAGELHAHLRKQRPKFGMIDALILATAQIQKQQLLTFDTDFRNLPGVVCIKKS